MVRAALITALAVLGGCSGGGSDDGLGDFPTTDAKGVDQVAFPHGDGWVSDSGPSPKDTWEAKDMSEAEIPPTGCEEGEACDDGNGCTEDDTCTNGVCVGVGKPCDDGVDCTTDSCEADLCVYTLMEGHCFIEKVCYSDGDSHPLGDCQRCLSSVALEAWTVQPNGTECDDGDSCTEDEVCVSGTCQGQGTLCPDDGDPCTKEICADGDCTTEPVPDGGNCDDGDPCSVGDTCSAGACKAGPEGKDNDKDGFYDDACVGGDDCNDESAEAKPGLAEICDDGLDNDCDGAADMADIDCENPVQDACTYHTDCYPERVCAVWTTTGQAVCSDPCAGDGDCGEGLKCSKVAGSANVGFCETAIPGGKEAGAVCTIGADCASGYCLGTVCASMCLDQEQCVGGSCALVGDPQTDYIASLCAKGGGGGLLPFGATCTNGVDYSGDYCTSAHCDLAPAAVGQVELSKCAPLCKTRDDCGPKQECNLVLYANQPAAGAILYDPLVETDVSLSALKSMRDSATGCFSVLLELGEVEGNLPDGTPCLYNGQCGSRLCLGLKPGDPTTYCTRLCALDESCAPGMQCKLEALRIVSKYLNHVGPLLGMPSQENWWTYARVCKFQ